VSIFGNKCVRCGARTHEVYQDKPTCDACIQMIELTLEAAKETRRLCPLDGSTLNKEIAHGVIVDRCTQCQGVWLDAGELDRINGDVISSMISGMYPPVP
jgi:hypothetical protein